MNRSLPRRFVATALPPFLFFVGAVLVWHFVVVIFDIKSFLIPRPMQVVEAFADNATYMLKATWMTTRVALSGFACSLVLGVGIALVFAREGAKVAIAARTEGRLEQVKQETLGVAARHTSVEE